MPVADQVTSPHIIDGEWNIGIFCAPNDALKEYTDMWNSIFWHLINTVVMK